MPLIHDPRRRWRWATALAGALPFVVVMGFAPWSWRALTPVPSASVDPLTVAQPPTVPLDPHVFQTSLWRPFSDQPATTGATAAPVVVKLFAVVQRQGQLTAAITIGGIAGLQYLKPGEQRSPVQVVAVTSAGVDILVNGVPQHLAVGR